MRSHIRKAIIGASLCGLMAVLCYSAEPQGQTGGQSTTAAPRESIGEMGGRLRDYVARFESFGSRVSGYAGCDRAAEFVEEEFRRLGLEKVSVQEFPLAIPVDEGGVLEVNGQQFAVYPLWPDLVRTPATPPNGITGPLIYAGKSKVEDYEGKEVEKALVLLDYNCQDNWETAFSLGAQAVLFIEPEAASRLEAEMKYLEVPASLPRYWVPRGAASALLPLADGGKATATVKCRMVWRNRVAKNIIGFLPGSDAELAEQCMVIQAYYDSTSVVPSLSPGAEQACGVAGLLEMVRFFKQQKPPRSILFVATAGHFQALSGMREFAQLFGAKGKRETDEAKKLEEAKRRKLDRISEIKDKIGYLQGLLRRPGVFAELAAAYKANIEELEGETKRLENDVALIDAFGYTAEGKVLRKPIFISLDLTSQVNAFGLFFAGSYYGEADKARYLSPFGKTLRKLMEPDFKAVGLDEEKSFVDVANPTQNMVWSDYFPGPIAFDSEMVIRTGRPGITFATINDAHYYTGTPHDSVSRFNGQNLASQVYLLESGLNKLFGLEKMANRELVEMGIFKAEELADAKKAAEKKTLHETALKRTDSLVMDNRIYDRRTGGRTLEFVREKSFLPNTPVPNALVLATSLAKSMMGVSGTRIVMSDSMGDFLMTGHNDGYTGTGATLEAYKIDESTGEICYAPDMGSAGAIYPRALKGRERSKRPIILFPCKPIALFDIVDQRFFMTLQQMYLYDADSGGEPMVFDYVLRRTLIGQMQWEVEPVAVVFTDPGHAVNITLGMGILGPRMLLLNGTEARPKGNGFDSEKVSSIPFTAYQAAKDMWLLDDSRITKLTEKGISNERIQYLHGKAKEALAEADAASQTKDYRTVLAASHKAWGYEASGYPDVMGTSRDVVYGVVFYLLLVLPFCYFMERLLFGFGEIGKRIAATVGIFAVIYAILRSVHPAFALVMTGEVILLAFVVGTLAMIVIVIIVTKFNEQLEKMKQELAGIHKADVGRISAWTTAFSLGVANMRRRKLRTSLTSATLILLTFTVLSFTSVKSIIKPNRLEIRKAKPVYNGVLIRDRMWGMMERPTYETLRQQFPGAEAVVPRAWFSSPNVTTKLNLNMEGKGGKIAVVNAVLGLTPEEQEVTGATNILVPGGRWFKEEDQLACILPESVAKQVGIGAEDAGKATVKIFGVPYTVIGIAYDEKLGKVVDLDGESVLPVDYSNLKPELLMLIQTGAQAQTDQTFSGKGGMEQLLSEYSHFTPAQVALMPYTSTLLMGGTLRSIAIRLPEGKEPKPLVQEMLDRVALSMYASEGDKVFLYSAIAISSPEAPGGLVIPILIAALIVLNTMLGAVYERVREIGIFSAVGLAPIHIFVLFLAEALVYAVIGAIIGYLLGQAVAQLVLHFGWLGGVNLNYSSMSAVMGVVVVVATVLISTMYPARKAAQMSVPDIERKWKLPEPEGDIMRAKMPFSLTGSDSKACSMFMVEFFDSYVGFAGGEFYTENVSLDRMKGEYGEGYKVSLKAWLAPYDLGVSQMIDLLIVPTEEGDIYGITLDVKRESGDINSWKKTNWLFLNTLRKQFLIWRTIAPEDRLGYARRAEEMMEAAKATA